MKLVAFERASNGAPIGINPEYVVRIEDSPPVDGKPPSTKLYFPMATGDDRMPAFVVVRGDFMEVARKLEGS